jgi:hypothetical protein
MRRFLEVSFGDCIGAVYRERKRKSSRPRFKVIQKSERGAEKWSGLQSPDWKELTLKRERGFVDGYSNWFFFLARFTHLFIHQTRAPQMRYRQHRNNNQL